MNPACWGQFPPAVLDQLAAILKDCDYAGLADRPWFQTRHQMPAMDWWYSWQCWRGRPRPLACHSNPEHYWRGMTAPQRRWHSFFWGMQALPSEPALQALMEGGLVRPSPSRSQVPSGSLVELEALCQVSVLKTRSRQPRLLLSSAAGRSPGNFVYLGDDTGLLIERVWGHLKERPSHGRLLDICCGSGAISLALAEHFQETVGSDLNEDAIGLANSALQLNRRLTADSQLEKCSFVSGPGYQAVEGKFDWIVGNPPALPGVPRENLYASGGESSTDLTLSLVAGLEQYLADNGRVVLLTFSPGLLLWQQLQNLLTGRFSLNYVIRARFECSVSAAGQSYNFLDHVFVEIVRDSKGRRILTSQPLWRKLAAWTISRPQPADYIRRLP